MQLQEAPLSGPFFCRAVDREKQTRYDNTMVKSYIIHLERSTERAPLVARLKDALPNASVVSAVYGRDVPPDDVKRLTSDQISGKPYPFKLLPGELGCFLSHRKVWNKFIQSGEDYAIVSEDDAVLGQDFAKSLNLATTHISPNRLIRFPIKAREKPSRTIATAGDIELFIPQVVGLTTTMYLVGRDAAQKLLNGSNIIDRPIDVWMQMRWETGVDSLSVWPSHISAAPADQTGSTIQGKSRGIREEVTKSLKRSRYRAWVARKSKTS